MQPGFYRAQGDVHGVGDFIQAQAIDEAHYAISLSGGRAWESLRHNARPLEPARQYEACGGTYSTEQAVRDGNIVTARTWESHPDFYREIFRCRRKAQ